MKQSLVVLLSGEIATGKSSIAKILLADHGLKKISTGLFLQEEARKRGLGTDRSSLQQLGTDLDHETKGNWVSALLRKMIEHEADTRWLLDSVRIPEQVGFIRALDCARVLHVHVTARPEVAKQRFHERLQQGGEYAPNTDYDEVKNDPTEQRVRELHAMADLVIDSSDLSPIEAAEKLGALLR